MEIQLSNKDSITKADINFVANDLLEKLESGEINPLLLLQKFKAIEKIQESVKSIMIEGAVTEVSKYPEKGVELFGCVFTKKEVGTSYDYSRCNDGKYLELLEIMEKAKKELKKREDFLKAIEGHETVVNTDTGEIETIYPPIKTSTTSVTTSIK